jgi:uncharacterized membrane protein YqjE
MDASDGEGRAAGLKPATLRLLAGAVALARTRLELASVELAEERARVTSIVVFAAAGAILATLTVAALTLGIVAYFWDSYRFQAIGALVVVYGVLALLAFRRARMIVTRQPTPFSATLAEFEKDRAILAGGRMQDVLHQEARPAGAAAGEDPHRGRPAGSAAS